MARYNEILEGRFNRALQKLFSMKGEPPAPQLASEIMPTFQYPLGIEFRYLEGWETFFVQTGVTGVAAQNSGVRVRNPAKSGVITVVDRIFAWDTGGPNQQVKLGIPLAHPPGTFADFSSVAQSVGMDGRSRQSSTTVVSQGTFASFFAAGITQVALVATNAGATGGIEVLPRDVDEWVITPGQVLDIFTNNVNTTFQVTIRYKERPIADSEVS